MKRLSELSLSLFLFLLPWQTIWIIREYFHAGVKLQYETLGFFATEIFLWIAVISFLLWRQKELGEKPRVFALTALLFVVYAYLSSLWAPDSDIALQHALWILEAFLLFFLLLAGPLQKKRVWAAIAAGSIAPAILGIAQFLTQTTFASTLLGLADHPAWEAGTSMIDAGNFGRWLRAYGTFSHPNLFGGYLMVAIVALDSLARMDRRYLIDDKKNIIYHISFIVISILQWTALFFTFSRSAWLAAGAWLALLAFRRDMRHMTNDTRRIIIYHLSSVVILTIVFFPLVQTRISGDTMAEARSKTERISGYSEALALWRSKPLTGIGVGNYTIAARNTFPNRAPWEYQPVHNIPLLMGAELGILGILLAAMIIINAFRLLSISYNLSVIAPILPLFLFDHYLWSSFAGLFFLPILASQLIPNPSTGHPQNHA